MLIQQSVKQWTKTERPPRSVAFSKGSLCGGLIRILFVTIRRNSFSVWLEVSTNHLLKSKLIMSEVSTDAELPHRRMNMCQLFVTSEGNTCLTEKPPAHYLIPCNSHV